MADDTPLSGKIPLAVGQASAVRIPVPGTGGLCVELRPRGHVPASGSTSTLFIQDITGKRHLRLDYGYNKTTNSVDFHWNQKGTHAEFGVTDHTPVGKAGQAAFRAAKYFRYAGRTLAVVGVALDVVSIVYATNPMRRASEVVTSWALGWVGCKGAGAGGAALGTLVAPGPGTATGGIVGCIVGGITGYALGAAVAGQVYDWAEGTRFMPLQNVDVAP
jgi:hypothetical protein